MSRWRKIEKTSGVENKSNERVLEEIDEQRDLLNPDPISLLI